MATSNLTRERLRELLHYDPETGIFTRLVATGRHGCNRAGIVAGGRTPQGYIQIRVDSRLYKAHRLAWLWVHGEMPAAHTDHINGDRADNRIANLRPATCCENLQNQLRPQLGKSVPCPLGVNWHAARGKWVAAIQTAGKREYLGIFHTAQEASEAYLAAKRSRHPFGTL